MNMKKKHLSLWHTRNLSALFGSLVFGFLSLLSFFQSFLAEPVLACEPTHYPYGTPPPSQWCAIPHSDYTWGDYENYLRSVRERQEYAERSQQAQAFQEKERQQAAHIKFCASPRGTVKMHLFGGQSDLVELATLEGIHTEFPGKKSYLRTEFHALTAPGTDSVTLLESQDGVEDRSLHMVSADSANLPAMISSGYRVRGYLYKKPQAGAVAVKSFIDPRAHSLVLIATKSGEEIARRHDFRFDKIEGYALPVRPECGSFFLAD